MDPLRWIKQIYPTPPLLGPKRAENCLAEIKIFVLMLSSLSSFSSPGLQGDKSGVNLDHNVDDTEQVLEMFKEKPHKEGSTEVQSLTTGTRPKESQVKGTTFKIPTLQPYTTRDKAQPFVNSQRPRKTRFRQDPTLVILITYLDQRVGLDSY